MKLSNFINLIEKLGLQVIVSQFSILIVVPDNEVVIASIFKLEDGCLAMDKMPWDEEKQHKFLELCITLAMTEAIFR